MNGRIYDPKLGRMLQADPFIQSPTNSQSLNRYSYVLNNPLSYTDPSGYFFSRLWKKWVRPIAAIAITAVGMAFAPYLAPVWGALSGWVATGNLQGALVGAFSSIVFSGIGNAFASVQAANAARGIAGLTALQTGAKVLAHGIAGGIMSMMSGGKFGHGFASAGFTQSLGGRIGAIDAQNAGFSIQRTLAAAAVGGTASELTGGKFANGAITGAFSRAFNDEASHGKLSGIFDDAKFRFKLAQALARSKSHVIADLEAGYGNRTLGLALYADGEGGYNFGKYPNDIPNSNVQYGEREVGAFASARKPIVGASALAISLPKFARDSYILNSTTRWQELSNFVSAPVVVTGPSASIFVFDGYQEPTNYQFPRN